ncbi:MAG: hypothetical protein ABR511_04185 [Acidimicrobiales bacterium]
MKRTSLAPTAVFRRLLFVACVVAGILAGAVPVGASGGSGGGGAPATTVPPIQLAPDSPTLQSGQSEIVQVVISPAAPAGGAILSIAASNASVTVPATLSIGPGLSNGQFQITAAGVTASTPVTVTVTLGASSASVNLTVEPAAVPTLSSVAAFPRVVASGDAVTVNASLAASAPPGGVTVGLQDDSAALGLPASAFIPAGSNTVAVKVDAGPVAAPTVVTITASLGTATVTGQLEVDPVRALTSVAVSPTTTDGTKGSTGAVSVSVPADGNAFSVSLASSNPTVAGVAATVAFLDGQSTATFPIATTAVDVPTDVTISATVGATTMSATLTVVPTPPPPFDLQNITVSPSVVAGAGTATATLTTTTGAPPGGVTVRLSTSDAKLASVPATAFIPAGATSVTFPVNVPSQSGAVNVAIAATFQGRGRAVTLGVTSAKGGTLLQAPPAKQVLAPRPVNDPDTVALGFAPGGTVSVESGQMPPGISLISNFRPGEFVFQGSPQAAGTYTFELKFLNVSTPYTLPYVWVITPA